MSSNPLKRLGRGFSVRLSLWYTSIFTLSAAVLFLLVYVLLASALQRKDHEILEARLKEYAEIYQRAGVSALRNWIESNEDNQEKSFFVCVLDRFNNILWLHPPSKDWIKTSPPRLEFGYLRQTV